jgi:hypothetical protein
MSIEHINLRIETAFLLRGAFEGQEHLGLKSRPDDFTVETQQKRRQALIDSMKLKEANHSGIAMLIFSAHIFAKKMKKSRRMRECMAVITLLNAVVQGVFIDYDTDESRTQLVKNVKPIWSLFVGIVFMLELCIKVGACGEQTRPHRYFLLMVGDHVRRPKIDRIFDTAVILLGCFVDPIFFVCRLARIGYLFDSKSLRLPALTLINAAEVLVYAILMLSWVVHSSACIGVVLFGKNDPQHYATLSKALFTQVRLTTLDDWYDIW